MAVRVKTVRWELLYVCFGEASGLGISQPLGQVQKGLDKGKRGGSVAPRVGGLPNPTSQHGKPRDLIVLHFHIIHIQIQADGGPHRCW